MSQPLPRLRLDLDFMPSPVEDRPGLLIRDSYGYSEAILIIPPPLVPCLECFDGVQTENDLRAKIVQITGDLDTKPVIDQIAGSLHQAGFLHDEVFEQLREDRHTEFANSPVRMPAHAGTAYPFDPGETKATLDEYLKGTEPGHQEGDNLIAIAAPHVSPFGGWQTYKAAYSALGPAHKDRTFIILGTSHYGQPDTFGLTRKTFVTPYGEAKTNLAIVDELSREPAVLMEDYCHAIEHSIEFQVLFLQHLYGPEVNIVPILCGSYAKSILEGGLPEDNEDVRRFLDKLGDIGEREGKRLLWVLGIDMAHMGERYGDDFEAVAGQGGMQEVARRDTARIDRINASDADGFWDMVQENRDDLKWCGSSPVYTFLRARPKAPGVLRGYEQWNIDEASVVSFGAMAFTG